jgi:glucokinase
MSAPVNSGGTASEILEVFEKLGREIRHDRGLSAEQICGVSVGIPNPFDYEQGISYMRHKYGSLYGQNVKAGLAERLKVAPRAVTFVNDAFAYLLGELHSGAASGATRAIGITLGTGVGSAFAVNGRIVTTGENVPNQGFLWNLPYEGGIVEDVISTRAIQHIFESRTGKLCEVREIAMQAGTSRDAAETMSQFGRDLGRVLKQVCRDFRPEIIAIGGAIARSADLFLSAAEEQLAGSGTRLAVSRLFDDASLLGAAVAWERACALP